MNQLNATKKSFLLILRYIFYLCENFAKLTIRSVLGLSLSSSPALEYSGSLHSTAISQSLSTKLLLMKRTFQRCFKSLSSCFSFCYFC